MEQSADFKRPYYEKLIIKQADTGKSLSSRMMVCIEQLIGVIIGVGVLVGAFFYFSEAA